MLKPPNIDIEQLHAAAATKRFGRFVGYIKPDYIFRPFNEYLMKRLDAFAKGEIKKLMVFMPPQHGKSQLTTRMLPAYILGLLPNKKISISSYSATIAHEFARDAKNIILSHEYRVAFPKTNIGREVAVKMKGSFADTAHYYQTSEGGFIYSVGRGGSLTSKTVDISITDDPLKDRSEAMSATVKGGLDTWYNDVVRTRLHNESQELMILTRWVEDDLAGRLLKKEADKWEVISFPAIKTKDYSPYDKRKEGEPLFPEKHSLERLLEAKQRNEVSFNSLYQQDPKPNSQIMVHPDFVKIKEFPDDINKWIVGLDYGFNDQIAVVAIGCKENCRYWKPLLYKPAKEIIAEMKLDVKKFNDDRVDDITVNAVYQALKFHGLEKALCYSEHHKVKILKLQQLGVPCYLANKDVANGIEKVNNYKNYYLESDTATYNEISKYQFKTIGEIILDVPVDGNDHIMNAGRYGIYTDSVMCGY